MGNCFYSAFGSIVAAHGNNNVSANDKENDKDDEDVELNEVGGGCGMPGCTMTAEEMEEIMGDMEGMHKSCHTEEGGEDEHKEMHGSCHAEDETNEEMHEQMGSGHHRMMH